VLKNGALNFGFDDLTEQDERYRWASEYVEVAYKLWEGSWEDDALLRDVKRGIHADPAKIHKINHRGERYRVEGPHLPAPSPQRTPVVAQAGSSPAGRDFAARHAEAQFIIASVRSRRRHRSKTYGLGRSLTDAGLRIFCFYRDSLSLLAAPKMKRVARRRKSMTILVWMVCLPMPGARLA
jgi:alkanesulfonate monooxygenase SsuD/methylene tetrahydromethanopterin reductase-like flavin-dependent oxidoreductase (luciferase family)